MSDNPKISKIKVQSTSYEIRDANLWGVVDDIQDKIPVQASSDNQLADKNFVNSSIQTNTATFRGNYETWEQVPTEMIADNNDYLVVRDLSVPTWEMHNEYMEGTLVFDNFAIGYYVAKVEVYDSQTPPSEDPNYWQEIEGWPFGPEDTVIEEGTWRFKYVPSGDTYNKYNWIPEYQVNEKPLTAAQLAALNSNITAAKVQEIDEKYVKPSTGIPASDLASGVIPEAIFERGAGENSVQQKGTSAEAISEASIAMGKNSSAGLKGFYYKYIKTVSTATVNIYFSREQVVPGMGSSTPTKDTTIQPSDYLAVGDILSIVNDSKHYNTLRVAQFLTGGGGVNAVWVNGSAPFNSIKSVDPLNPDDYCVYCLSKPEGGIADIGKGAIAIGEQSDATNLGAVAFGYKNKAWGNYSFTEGRENEAGYIGHAEGHHTQANGIRAHAEGYYTKSVGSSSHAEGQHTAASGQASHIEGHSASDVSDETLAKNNTDIISDWESTKFSLAKGVASHVEGKDNLGLGNQSHAEGYMTRALNRAAHAEGYHTTASGSDSHAEGYQAIAEGDGSHAEGDSTHAEGTYSHTEGQETIASGIAAHAEGCLTEAIGDQSHVEGYGTVAGMDYEHVEGTYNINTMDSIHVVGIGSDDDNRKNAHTITNDGKHYIPGIGTYQGTETVLPSGQDLATIVNGKQPTLVSGTNIKTINNTSLLGSGNIDLGEFATMDEIEAIFDEGGGGGSGSGSGSPSQYTVELVDLVFTGPEDVTGSEINYYDPNGDVINWNTFIHNTTSDINLIDGQGTAIPYDSVDIDTEYYESIGFGGESIGNGISINGVGGLWEMYEL